MKASQTSNLIPSTTTNRRSFETVTTNNSPGSAVKANRCTFTPGKGMSKYLMMRSIPPEFDGHVRKEVETKHVCSKVGKPCLVAIEILELKSRKFKSANTQLSLFPAGAICSPHLQKHLSTHLSCIFPRFGWAMSANFHSPLVSTSQVHVAETSATLVVTRSY